MKFTAFLFSFTFYIGIVTAQHYTMFNYSLEEGLPSSEVYQVFQDKKGFIWFATDNGIVRFDGGEIEIFHIKDGLSDPVIFGFQEDEEDRIWLKSYTGKLSFIENGEIKKYKYNNKISEVVKKGIPNFTYSAKDKELNFIARNILCRIDSIGNVSIESVKEDGLYYFGSIENGIWDITRYQITDYKIVINDQEFSVSLSNKPFLLSEFEFYPRSIGWKGNLYLTIKNNIFSYDGKKVTRVYSGPAPIISLSTDNQGNLWIGYMNAGTEIFESRDFLSPKKVNILNDKSITSILQDNENGIWFSTLENGVYYFPDLQIENYELFGNSKTLQVSSNQNKILVSNQNGELGILNATTKETLLKRNTNSLILSFLLTSENKIWLSANDQIQIFDSTLNLLEKKTASVNSFLEESVNGVLAYGGGKVYNFDRGGDIIDIYNLSQHYRDFFFFKSKYYFSGKTGLHIRDNKLQLLSAPKSFEDYKITDFTLLNDTSIILNTLGSGLLLLNTNTLHHKKFNTSNNFIANNIYTSVKKDSTLWLGTEVGLIKMNLHSLLDGKPEFERWDKKNGLISNDIKFLAVTSVNVWAFADNGYSVIPKTQFDHPPALPKPYLKSLTINDSTYQSFTTDINLDYKNTSIILKIGYLSFTNQDITSRYRLSKNDAWIYTNERIIPFNSLAPDHYIFELQYTIDNVHWIPAEINFNFNITPPWWQVWYFQAAIISIFILFILLYARYQIKNYKQKNLFLNIINSQQQKLVKAEVQITERERKRIAKELHDGVGTDLVVVKLKVMDLLSKKENEEDAVKEINDQFNATIKEIKNISYGLTPPELERFGIVVALSNYVKNISQSLETKIHFSATNPVVQKGEIEIVVFRVLQELISNTIRHAKAKNIHITLSSTEHALTIDYKDDGIGFSYAEIENGLGLANIESRVQSVNGKITFESKDAGVQYKIEIPATQG